jgi:voltage-gated potassium channel Kch
VARRRVSPNSLITQHVASERQPRLSPSTLKTARLRGRVAIYVTGGALLLAFCAALTALDAERSNPEANITQFGDAIWWAVTTMTTVGMATATQ